ncbi:MAG TPA: hypothetical protein VFV66_22560, partial [Nonomuraea sp.]|nr:hypothetical protein [Nonomuraea sp.]
MRVAGNARAGFRAPRHPQPDRERLGGERAGGASPRRSPPGTGRLTWEFRGLDRGAGGVCDVDSRLGRS